uniref:S1 RNA-binding domain-containing protein 1 n=1 Tax=Pristiophorus japonicus TaxID=55135 RepID=UPI00398E89E4
MESEITPLTSCHKRPFSEEDDSFFEITSESDSEEEEEWVPKNKIARKPKRPTAAKSVTVKKQVKPKAENTGTKKATVKRTTAKTAVKKNRKKTPEKTNVEQNVMGILPVFNNNEDKLPSQSKQNLGNMKQEEVSQQTAMQIKKEIEHGGVKVEQPSTSTYFSEQKIKEEADISFTWEEPALKKQKTENYPDGKPVKLQRGCVEIGDTQMNWNITQVLSERTNAEVWVCANLIRLFKEENTIPFIARYRKELTNNMDADTLREVQQTLEELNTVIKKAHTAVQKIAKEEKLTPFIKTVLLNCTTVEEVEHVFAPYKSGSKKTKAQKARQLGLESAANLLLDRPGELNLNNYIKGNEKGLSSVAEIETGIQHILADMMSKDRETLDRIRKLCESNIVFIQSTLTKATAKEDGNKKDTEKFRLYHNFSNSIGNVHHHQILAINRGEKLKILTVKVSIPDRVKNEFCRWCVNERWRPRSFARPEFMKILTDSADDSYKRLIYPLLCREFRSRLTSDAEKESIAMFGRNLRQLLLINPVRGRVLMGIDPGFRHGCKLSIISPTNQILHTDVIYLLGQGAQREAEKIRHLLHKYSCLTIVIGNGTACRETESFFADLINRRYFAPLDVVYCITSEAGASIYSVSPEAAKEMPDLDPNIRSAVSIARRVQDPLAELVKIDPKHIGVGMYQHDVSQTLLKATLDSVVEECVSFVGVDINIISETLMRHVAGLNASRAKNIIEWREKNGPFISREQLKEVKGLGPKTFQQCAGFIRINPENIKNFCSNQQQSGSTAGGQQATEAGSSSKAGAGGGTVGKSNKRKGKAQCSSPQPNPLDQTCIHPESYNTAMRFLSFIGGNLCDIGKPTMQYIINTALKTNLMDALTQKLDTTVPTLQMIIDGLKQPHDYDIRAGFEQRDFKRNIVSLNDLKNGTILTGRVENATLFGVFVDIGVGKSGLIPIRYITAAKLPASKTRRSLGLGPGERVEVKVMEIDHVRNRISLDLIRVL